MKLRSTPSQSRSRGQKLAETLLVFAVFAVQGARPVPEVNEPYYLSRAKHFWNPSWAEGDFFLETPDAHQVFNVTVGWLSLLMPLSAFAWTGRLVTWGLMAWGWRRLSYAVVARPWFSILTAAWLALLVEHCAMAGEWVFGGLEAKGPAYALVFFGLEALVRNRWNRVWILLGTASAFHVLVGGWSVVAAGVAWLLSGKSRPSLVSMAPALGVGFLLSLAGLVPGLMLNWGASREVIDTGNLTYVFARLSHHLVPSSFVLGGVVGFSVVTVLWLVLPWLVPPGRRGRRLRRFVWGALAIAAAGLVIDLLLLQDVLAYLTPRAEDRQGVMRHATFLENRELAAALLRYYWFRLADVAVPMGLSLGGASAIALLRNAQPRAGVAALAFAVAGAAVHFGAVAWQRMTPTVPRAVRAGYPNLWRAFEIVDNQPIPNRAAAEKLERQFHEVNNYQDWRDVCAWIAQDEDIPRNACFLTPRESQTFKWFTGHPEVATRKDNPQDAVGLKEWWNRLGNVYGRTRYGDRIVWWGSLAQRGALEGGGRLGTIPWYGADYVLTVSEPRLDLPVMYQNDSYVVYRLRE